MRQFVVYFVLIYLILSFTVPYKKQNIHGANNHPLQDTCILDGIVYQYVEKECPQKINAIIQNGRIKVIGNSGEDYKVIRYVFSLFRNEKVPLVRSFSDLVSYPVLQTLKKSEPGDQFYFEDIIVVGPNKTIIENAIKPVVIERVK